MPISRMVWTVAGLVQAVADALASRFSVCTVRGELTGFSRAASGHCYFCLKDADGQNALIRCAMFRRAASLLDFSPGDGLLVELRGRLTVYEPRGELQFVVEAMQRAGDGALFEQFLRLKARLEAEGLFDAQRKRALPTHPRRIGIVTSLAAAALYDVVTSMRRRAPHVEVIVYPSPVQGAEAPLALAAAIAQANQHALVDALIVCRGGGSLDDLWAFNDERVVRAIVASRLPIVCGVGHETDVTLCDFAADVRAPTPTAAAELATEAREDSLDTLFGLQSHLARRVRHALDSQAQRLDTCALRLARPTRLLGAQALRVAMLGQRLSAAVHRSVERHDVLLADRAARRHRAVEAACARHRLGLGALEARLNALDPQRVLARGYAWLADTEGLPILSASSLSPGESINAQLVDGVARLTVADVRLDSQS